MLFWAIFPIFLIVFLLLGPRWPLVKVAPLAFGSSALIAILIWKLPAFELLYPLVKGLLLALDISFIILGALCLSYYLKSTGHTERLLGQLNLLSQNRPELVLLFAWFFGSFIEAVSGFGTPGAIIAPFLCALGIMPIKAIAITLAANSTAVTFGAVGTPMRVGMADYLDLDFLPLIGKLNFIPAMIMPFVILYLLGPNLVRKYALTALLSGLFFWIPYFVGTLLGIEYPSIMGGGIGFLLMLFYLARKSQDFNYREFFQSFFPYIALVIILFVGKSIFASFDYRLALGEHLHHNIGPFNPGFAFFTLILMMALIYPLKWRELFGGKDSFFPLLFKTFLSIFFIGSLTYLMVMTDGYFEDANGMMQVLAIELLSPSLTYYSVFIGAFGSFLAGSATVSNLLFTPLQALGATQFDLNLALVLALQATGAAAGNMVALPNILAIKAAVQYQGSEGSVLKKLFIPCFLYLFIVALVSNIFI